MKKIALFTLTSALHDELRVDAATREFLDSLQLDFEFKGSDFSTYGSSALNLIFVRTGGTESIFLPLLPHLLECSSQPIYLLTNGKSNSLAASLEILSYLRQKGIQGEILHGSAQYIREKIQSLLVVAEAKAMLRGSRIGVIGKPSDWLIASNADRSAVKEKLGIEIVDIAMQEVMDEYQNTAEGKPEERIYIALKNIVGKHNLRGFTIRCFDLLSSVRSTGCLALARLNAEGCVSGCEGDVPALISMMVVNSVCAVSGFQANPARINPESGEVLFAHCTIPLNMVESYELDTHFESGIGVGIRGYMKNGPVTIFKLSPNLDRCFAAEGKLVESLAQPDLCRTQQRIVLNEASMAKYFLTDPIGNHHIIAPGHIANILRAVAGLQVS